ncbi:MAG: hypothetical protein ACYTAN_13275 [Planctomycetota bacterium]|jgi:hypothetical protein
MVETKNAPGNGETEVGAPPGPGRTATTWAAIIIVILAVVFTVPYLLGVWVRGRALRPGRATGDDLDIRFAGVIPDLGADLYDAAGNKAEPCMGVDGILHHSDSLTFRRTFVFDVPEAENLVLARQARHRPSGQPESAWGSTSFSYGRLEEPLDGRYYLTLTLFREYHAAREWPWPLSYFNKHEKKTLTDADVALQYWYGPRGKAAYTFEGPFEDGARVAVGPGDECSVSVKSSADGTQIDVDLTGGSSAPMAVLVYDRTGKRLTRHWYQRSTSQGGVPAGTTLQGMSPSDIAFITVGEEPRERTFHKIAVLRSDWPDFFAEYKAAIEERIGERLNINRQWVSFDSPEAALEAADLLRGEHIARVFFQPILHGTRWPAEALESRTRERAVAAARLWLGARDPRIGGAGACLGALLSLADFRDDLFKGLESEDTQVRAWTAEVFRLLREDLVGEDISRIADALIKGTARGSQNRPVSVVLQSRTPEAASAALAFALDERPRLWCHGLADERALAALGPFDGWPDERRVRRYIAMGREGRAENPNGALAEGAARILPSLLTAELAAVDRDAFGKVLRATVDLCEKDAAIAALVDFLRGALLDGRSSNPIIDAVAYINGLAGVNIAHLGSDSDREFQMNWVQAAGDAIAW